MFALAEKKILTKEKWKQEDDDKEIRGDDEKVFLALIFLLDKDFATNNNNLTFALILILDHAATPWFTFLLFFSTLRHDNSILHIACVWL